MPPRPEPTAPSRSRTRKQKPKRGEREQPLFIEESHTLPLVDFVLTLRTGSIHDPVGREGLSRIVGRMLRMGTATMDGPTVEEKIARLGGALSIETATSFVRLHGTVIRRNAEPFLELVASLLTGPAFRASDLAQVKRETIADIVATRDNDRGLGGRHFRRFLFGAHPYARSVVGSRASVRAIQRADIIDHFRTHFVASSFIFGAAGDVRADETRELFARAFADLPHGRVPRDSLGAPSQRKGRHVLIVDKPDRTQTQLFIGTLGSRINDPDMFPLMLANTAFGGTFTARLMHEVRSVRGWSYGAYSRLGHDRERDAWYMWTFPAAKDAAACARLQIELLDKWVAEGITRKELGFARDYLSNSHCFDVDTPPKRLEQRIDEELYGLPSGYYDKYVSNIRRVKLDAANEAVRRRIRNKDLAIVVVATAKQVARDFEQLPGVESLEVVRFNQD